MNRKYCINICAVLILLVVVFQIEISFTAFKSSVKRDVNLQIGSECLCPEDNIYNGYKTNPIPSQNTLEGKMYPNLRKCETKIPTLRYVQRNNFWVLENYIQATKKIRCDQSITYTTHGEYWFLDNLITVAARWKGPISVAVYAPGSDFDVALETIFYIRNCVSNDVKKYVTFHLFFDIDHFPKTIPHPSNHEYVSCEEMSVTFNLEGTPENGTYRSTNFLLYPINVARNIARSNANTYFIFASDIELYPSINIIPEFFKMLQKPDISRTTNRRVYVLPVFEVQKFQEPPDTKAKLVGMLRKRIAIVFHQRICRRCHLIPKYQKWRMSRRVRPELSVLTIGKRHHPYRTWEPFYIGTNDEPVFDERLTSEGRANKMTQAYAMCLLDYEYHILDTAFVVHRPGIKIRKEEVIMNDFVERQNELISNVIKTEYQIFFGANKECEVHGRS